MMQPGQGAIVLPAAEVEVDRAASWQVFWDRTPMAAGAQEVHQPVENLANIDRALVAAPLSSGDHRLDQRSFLACQVARIAQLTAVVTGAVLVGPHRKLLRIEHFREGITTDSPNSRCFWTDTKSRKASLGMPLSVACYLK